MAGRRKVPTIHRSASRRIRVALDVRDGAGFRFVFFVIGFTAPRVPRILRAGASLWAAREFPGLSRRSWRNEARADACRPRYAPAELHRRAPAWRLRASAPCRPRLSENESVLRFPRLSLYPTLFLRPALRQHR